jgi:hypothetical protein
MPSGNPVDSTVRWENVTRFRKPANPKQLKKLANPICSVSQWRAGRDLDCFDGTDDFYNSRQRKCFIIRKYFFESYHPMYALAGFDLATYM